LIKHSIVLERVIKIILAISLTALIIVFAVKAFFPKGRLSSSERQDLERIIASMNEDLPRSIGTVGALDSVFFADNKVCYNMSILGDPSIIEVYRSEYEKFKTVSKYAFFTMNGQNGNATKLASYEAAKSISNKLTIFVTDGQSVSWDIPGKELLAFINDFQGTPTEAMADVIDFQLSLAAYQRNTVSSNAVSQLEDEGLFLSSLSREDNSIVWSFTADESLYDLDKISENAKNKDFINYTASVLVQDPDVQELMNMISISHSDFVIRYKGNHSHNTAEIFIPYMIIKEYSQVPSLH